MTIAAARVGGDVDLSRVAVALLADMLHHASMDLTANTGVS
jgi:hypothetical protein